MNIKQSFLTNNPCYVNNVNKVDSRYTSFQKNGPLGLMLHSVGCSQPSASVFINNWNKSTYTNACVHGFIDANTGDVYQTLPWNYRGWHGGGSSNNTHLGIEMCESKYITYTSGSNFTITNKALAQADCKRTYDAAVELFAMLCRKFNLNPLTAICSHTEGYKKGISSNHGDPEHYWHQLGMPYTMDKFRTEVKAKMESEPSIKTVNYQATTTTDLNCRRGAGTQYSVVKTYPKGTTITISQEYNGWGHTVDGWVYLNYVSKVQQPTSYLVKITVDSLNVRSGPGTNYSVVTVVKKDYVYTIVETKNGWGKLKSGTGWIYLNYTVRC